MSNRFRTIIKGTSSELISAGKQGMDSKQLNIEAYEQINPENEVKLEDEGELERDIEEKVSQDMTMPDNSADMQEVSDFLKQRVNSNVFEIRVNKFKDIINAMISCDNKHTAIIDSRGNIENWVKSIKLVLPLQIVEQLSFGIYDMENPGVQKLVVIGENEKNIDGSNLSSEELITFNCITGTWERIEFSSKFSEFMQIGLFLQDQSLNTFKMFARDFSNKKLDRNIDSCLELFNILNNGLGNYDSQVIEKALNFANEHASTETLTRLYKLLEKNICNTSLTTGDGIVLNNFKYVFKVAEKIYSNINFESLYDFIFKYTKYCLQDTDADCVDGVINFYNNIKNLGRAVCFNFEEYVIQNNNTNSAFKAFMDNNPNFAKFYFMIILVILREKNELWKSKPEYGKFVYEYMHKSISSVDELRTLVDSINDNPELVINLITLYYSSVQGNPEQTEAAINIYIDKLDTKWVGQDKNIRSLIIKTYNNTGFIFEEFKLRLNRAKEKDVFFWNYTTDVFESFPSYKEEYFSEALSYYHDIIINLPELKKEYPRIFNMVDKGQIKVNNDVLAHIIEDYEKDLSFDSIDQVAQLILKVIGRIKKTKVIKTTNDISTFFEFGTNLQKAVTNGEIKRLLNDLPNPATVSEDKFDEFVLWCLEILFNSSVAKSGDIYGFYNGLFAGKSTEKFVNCLINSKGGKIEGGNLAKVQFYLVVTIEYLASIEHEWDKTGSYESFIYSCMDIMMENASETEKLFDRIIKEEHYLVNVLLKYFSKFNTEKNNAVEYFVGKVKLNGEDWARRIRVLLWNYEGQGDFLFGEYMIGLNDAAEKSVYFWNYYKEVFRFMPEYCKKYFSNAAQHYLEAIKRQPNYEDECINISKLAINGEVVLIGDIISEVIKVYEQRLPLTTLTEETRVLIEGVAKIKAEYGIVTKPDITEMVRFVLSLDNMASQEEIRHILQTIKLKIDDLDINRYVEYLNWCFEVISQKINFVECADELNDVLCIEKYKNNYRAIYNGMIYKQISNGVLTITKLQIKRILIGLDGDVKATIDTLLMYFSQCIKDDNVKDSIEMLINTLGKYNYSDYSQAIKYLNTSPGGNEMLFEEFKYKLYNAPNKPEFFWSYCAKVVNEFKKDRGAYYGMIVEEYLASMKDTPEYAKECYRVIRLIAEDQAQVNHELIVNIVKACESLIEVGRPDREHQMIINNITRIKEEEKVVTVPDITALLNFCIKVEAASDPREIRLLLDNAKISFEEITLSNYESFLDWCLPKVIGSANSWNTHTAIKKLLCDDKREGLFFIKYFGILDTIVEANKVDGMNVFTRFLISFFNDRNVQKEEIIIQVRANASNLLIRQTETALKEMDSVLKTETSQLENRNIVLKEWDQLYGRALPYAKKDKNILGKIFKGSK